MNNIEVDRISSLPDEVLTHIVSFLCTKQAVQTCVLSKRWKNTWAAVPFLNIQHKDFYDFSVEDDDCNGDHIEELRMSVARFERFMTGFLDNRAPAKVVKVYCVRFIESFEPDASIGWLHRVALIMPLQIDILISNRSDHSLEIPDLIFSCRSLQHLWIDLYTKVITIISPGSINLPSLKCLELIHVELHDDFAQKLFMGCPSLERLILRGCVLYFSGIFSKVLKELTLNDCSLYKQMQISCPALVSLFMRTYLNGYGISLKNMTSLVNVVIKLSQYRGDGVPVLNLFGGLSNAAKLELHLDSTPVLKEQLEKDIPNCRTFNNLKKLVIGGKWDISYDFYLVACLLKHSPNLKELGLLLDESQCQIQKPRREVSGVLLFRHEYLETVKIHDLYERKNQLSSELINAMIKTLGTYVKKIGNMIINS